MKRIRLVAVAALTIATYAATCTVPVLAQNATPDAAVLERGKALFSTDAIPACAICHTLADAGAEGAIGPDLDELKPGKDVILKVLQEGMGAMPPFADTMSDEDKQAVADYIVKVTSQ